MDHNNGTSGRNCWGTARERERLRARFHIRERVSRAEIHHTATTTNVKFESEETADFVQQCLKSIHSGDRSKFSLSMIDKNSDLFSWQIPISHLDYTKEQRESLLLAWFGKEHASALCEYINSLKTFTFMEYAIWMGKYSIVGSLLIGGISPCIRGTSQSINIGSDTQSKWMLRMDQVGSRTLQRFFSFFPLSLEVHIVKRVVETRIIASELNKDCHEKPCQICEEKEVPFDFLIQFPGCQHTVCEPCFWEDLCLHIDGRGEDDDVIRCPVCNNCSYDKSESAHCRHTFDKSIFEMTSDQRREFSLDQYRNLPEDRQSLKSRRKKKKKPTEKDHIASSWFEAVLPSLGATKDVRRDKFFSFAERNAFHYMRGCLIAGVDVEWKNEYGQTALYICAWKGYSEMFKLLLSFGADRNVKANDGSSLRSIYKCYRYQFLEELINCTDNQSEACHHECIDLQAILTDPKDIQLKTLIPQSASHPGAGSSTIDNALSENQVQYLLKLHSKLPVDTTQKKNKVLCSERSYFCDAEGRIRDLLEEIIYDAGLVSTRDRVVAFPYMRFLHYSKAGTVLAPHVDLCRVDSSSGLRSTHTFIAYLTTCESGGETCLLRTVTGEGRSERLASVSPRRGRLLLFPHACPHEGSEVGCELKILLRGEVMIQTDTTQKY